MREAVGEDFEFPEDPSPVVGSKMVNKRCERGYSSRRRRNGIEADPRRRRALLEHQCKTIPEDSLHLLPGPTSSTARMRSSDRSPRVLGALQSLFNTGRLAGHRLRLDPAGRSGHRALRRRVVRAEPRVLRPREHRQAGDRGRLQRRRPRRSACSARWRASTRTRFRSS